MLGSVLVVTKDHMSDEIIFSHKLKNVVILMDLYPPLQLNGVETSVARIGNSC